MKEEIINKNIAVDNIFRETNQDRAPRAVVRSIM